MGRNAEAFMEQICYWWTNLANINAKVEYMDKIVISWDRVRLEPLENKKLNLAGRGFKIALTAKAYSYLCYLYRVIEETPGITSPCLIDGWLVNTVPWFYGIKTFESINQATLSHPKHKDLIVTCTQEDYQQFDIKLCPMCIWKSNTEDIGKIYRSLPTMWESTVSKLAKGFKTPGLAISSDSDRHWSELFPEKEGTSCA